MKCILTLGPLTLLISTLSWADQRAVERLGDTSSRPYYRTLNHPTEDAPSKVTPLPPTPLHPYSEADMLPVRSERLSPGMVKNRATNTPGVASFFLIGDDDLSRLWLASRRDVLKKLNAVGLVVNVEQLDALTELRDIGSGLDIVPASADVLAERLGLQHYPLLITANGIEQ